MLQKSDVAGHQCRRGEPHHLPKGEIPRHHRQNCPERLVTDVTPAGRCLHHFVGQKTLSVFRIVAADPRAFRSFIDRGPKRLAHFSRHHPAKNLFFALQNCCRLQHHLRAFSERHFPVAQERIRSLLKFHFNLCIRQRLERLNHLPRRRIYRCDRHFKSPFRMLLCHRNIHRQATHPAAWPMLLCSSVFLLQSELSSQLGPTTIPQPFFASHTNCNWGHLIAE